MNITTEEAVEILLKSGMYLSIENQVSWFDILTSVIIPIGAVLIGGIATYYASYRIELKKLKLQDNYQLYEYINAFIKQAKDFGTHCDIYKSYIEEDGLTSSTIEKLEQKIIQLHKEADEKADNISNFYNAKYHYAGNMEEAITYLEFYWISINIYEIKYKNGDVIETKKLENIEELIEKIEHMGKEINNYIKDEQRELLNQKFKFYRIKMNTKIKNIFSNRIKK